MNVVTVLVFVSASAFIGYGALCLGTGHMKAEFERYGLSRYRTLVGALELLGGFGQVAGLNYPVLLLASTSGLSLLMMLGIHARWRVHDPLVLLLPAFLLLCVNLLILFHCLGPA